MQLCFPYLLTGSRRKYCPEGPHLFQSQRYWEGSAVTGQEWCWPANEIHLQRLWEPFWQQQRCAAAVAWEGPGCWRSRVNCPRFDSQENGLNPAASGCLPSTVWEVLVQNPTNQMPLLPYGQRLSLSLPSCCFFHTWQIMHIVISFLVKFWKIMKVQFYF